MPLTATTEQTELFDPMGSFARFQLNYPHDFIAEAFKDKGWIADHLEKKFNGFYDQHGARAVIIMFWCDLDFENRKTLYEYILTKFKAD